MSTWAIVNYWYTLSSLIIYAIFMVVLAIGGFCDLRYLFSELEKEEHDENDNGTVSISK